MTPIKKTVNYNRFQFIINTPEKRLKSSNYQNSNKPINFKFNNDYKNKTSRNDNLKHTETKNEVNNIHSFKDLPYNNNSKFINRNTETTNTKLIEKNSINLNISKNRIDDNLSLNSKFSGFSKFSKINNPLQPIEINNEEHLNKVLWRKELMKQKNNLIIENLKKNITDIKKNIISNIKENFKNRIFEIWSSYIKEQKKKMKDINSLINEMKPIESTFLSFLEKKINLVYENNMKKLLTDILKKMDLYLNRKIEINVNNDNYIYNKYKKLLEHNINLEKKYHKNKKSNLNELKENEKRYISLMNVHIENYIRELNFKIFNDNNIILNTLERGKIYTIKRINQINKSLKKKDNIIKKYKKIKKLENELKNLKNN